MNEEEIKKLAETEFEAREDYNRKMLMNVPQDYEERKKAAVQIAIIRAKMIEAQKKLEDAIKGEK